MARRVEIDWIGDIDPTEGTDMVPPTDATDEHDAIDAVRLSLREHGQVVGKTNYAQRSAMELEMLEVRNAEIAVEMEELSGKYELGEISLDDYDRAVDALAEESDAIEQLIEVKFGIIGGGRVFVSNYISDAVECANSLVSGLSRRRDEGNHDEEKSRNLSAEDEEWERKFEDAANAKSDGSIFDTPLLQRLSQYYESQIGDYDSQIRKRADIEAMQGSGKAAKRKRKEKKEQIRGPGIKNFDYDCDLGSFTKNLTFMISELPSETLDGLNWCIENEFSAAVYLEVSEDSEVALTISLVFVMDTDSLNNHEFEIYIDPFSDAYVILTKLLAVFRSGFSSFDLYSYFIGLSKEDLTYCLIADLEIHMSIPSLFFLDPLTKPFLNSSVVKALDYFLCMVSSNAFQTESEFEEKSENVEVTEGSLDVSQLYELIRPSWNEFIKTPEGLISPLSRYQERALSWMVYRENNASERNIENMFFKKFYFENSDRTLWFDSVNGFLIDTEPTPLLDFAGGILAEEMGLGKSIEMISLILENPRKYWSNGDEINLSESKIFDLRHNGIFSKQIRFSFYDEEGNYFKFEQEAQMIPKDCVIVESAATLIVAPSNILFQWRDEFEKHAPILNVLIYEGVKDKKSSYTAEEVAEYDVVITSYDIMKQELYYSQSFQYTLRGEKEFEIPESPLIQIGWWRIVMDEAQFIESPVAQSAKMASRLSTWNKWCVSGTPIGKHGLEDLFGLMLFLNFEPFCQRKVWKELIEERYNKGNNNELVSLLRKIMWRHKKIHVEDELVLPPIHYHKVEQTFSPIEEEYYNRLLQESHYMVLQNGAVDEVSAKWALIEKLRHACCHPQVSKDTYRHLLGTALEAQVFGMSEILNSMLSRSQDEVNASERELCRSLNRLAQFYKRFDNLELAEEAWIEAWRIEDGGIDYEARLTEQSRASKILIQLPERAFKNEQIRVWRMIEYMTIEGLKSLYESELLIDIESDRRLVCESNLKLLRDQSQQTRADILELDEMKVKQQKSLIKMYYDLMGNFSKLAVQPVLALYHAFLNDYDHFFQLYSKNLLSLEEQIIHYKKEREAYRSHYYLHVVKFGLNELIDVMIKNPVVMQVKYELLKQIKKVENNFDGNPENILTRFKKSIASVEKLITTNLSELKKLNLSVSPKPSVEFAVEEERKYRAEWERFSDSLSLIRVMKRIPIEKAILEESELNLANQIESLTESIKVPEFLEEHKSEILDAIQFQINKNRQIASAKFRHLVHLSNKFSNLTSQEEDAQSLAYNDSHTCSICQTAALRPVLTSCCHLFCMDCISKWLYQQSAQRQCAVCRTPLDDNSLFPLGESLSSGNNCSSSGCPLVDQIKVANPGQYGTKIESIVKHILHLEHLANSLPITSSASIPKALVFSQYPQMLQLVSNALLKNNLSHVLLDGNPKSRAKLIHQFHHDRSVRVMLMGLRKDSSGLTLVSAQHVFLLEPSLNPAIEDQAITRVHRRGQVEPIHVWRFIMNSSIEQQIVHIQEQKRLLLTSSNSSAVGVEHSLLNLPDLNQLLE